ncbi:hypothetical protein DUPY_32630 [Duganella phyllosphaerae]|uniref:Uncharacterized protein n=1 Tax=Duganella phyllosphaerae TaxID=762836 RepID=A0A1E7WHB4_9BURK|nr:hypothetical protein DUPY_32630 [Duganella phyllosphaerae]
MAGLALRQKLPVALVVFWTARHQKSAGTINKSLVVPIHLNVIRRCCRFGVFLMDRKAKVHKSGEPFAMLYAREILRRQDASAGKLIGQGCDGFWRIQLPINLHDVENARSKTASAWILAPRLSGVANMGLVEIRCFGRCHGAPCRSNRGFGENDDSVGRAYGQSACSSGYRHVKQFRAGESLSLEMPSVRNHYVIEFEAF